MPRRRPRSTAARTDAAARPWRSANLQDRSRATGERILDAFAAELDRRPLGMVSMAGLARRARVSIGGVYARFPGKDALLHALDERLLRELMAGLVRRLDPDRCAGLGLREVLGVYTGFVASMFRRHRTVLREVALQSRATGDRHYVERVRAFNQEAHGRLRGLAMVHRAEIRHPDPGAAIDFGMMFISAALREQILFGDRRLNRSRTRGERLVRELTRAWFRYLVSDDSA